MRRYALLGTGLQHSLSPLLHRALEAQSEYALLDTETLDSALDQLEKLDGYNVTKPYKTAIVPHLASLSEEAKWTGAVNCVVNQRGYNTDYLALHHILPSFSEQKILLLGAGGLARSVLYYAISTGASQVWVWARRLEQAKALCSQFSTLVSPKTRLLPCTTEELFAIEPDYVYQATSAGLWPHCRELPLPIEVLRMLWTKEIKAVFESIYNPYWTRFALSAKSAGLEVHSGLSLLLHQAIEARRLWVRAVGGHFELSETKLSKLDCDLRQRLSQNWPMKFVITGFMGAGKSSLVRALALKTACACEDLDERLERRFGLSPRELIEREGEEGFRDLEYNELNLFLLENEAPDRGFFLACGGGTLLREKAWRLVEASGALVLYLEVSPDLLWERLKGTGNRPLLMQDGKVQRSCFEALYEKRLWRYRQQADWILEANSTAEVMAQLGYTEVKEDER